MRVSIVRMKAIKDADNKIIVVDGLLGTGKSLISSVISGFYNIKFKKYVSKY